MKKSSESEYIMRYVSPEIAAKYNSNPDRHCPFCGDENQSIVVTWDAIGGLGCDCGVCEHEYGHGYCGLACTGCKSEWTEKFKVQKSRMITEDFELNREKMLHVDIEAMEKAQWKWKSGIKRWTRAQS